MDSWLPNLIWAVLIVGLPLEMMIRRRKKKSDDDGMDENLTQKEVVTTQPFRKIS